MTTAPGPESRRLRVSHGALTIPALAALLLAGCSGDRAPSWPTDNSLVVALENAPIQLDPRIGTDQASGRVYEVIFSGLLTKDTSGNLIPDLAESWEILDDGRRYRFRLRTGVTFHDGRALGSADVVYTFQTMIDREVVTPKLGGLPQLVGVEAVDPRTVDFHLSEPYGALMPNLTCFLGIIPAGSTTEELNRSPTGSGPFRFVSRTPDTVTVEPFDDYWEGRPPLDRLVLRTVPDDTVRILELRKGSVQLVADPLPDVVPMFRRSPHYQVIENPGSNYAYLGVNLEDPILADPAVRRAIALSLDRQLLIDTLWNRLGLLTETMIPPGHWARNNALEPIPHDVEAARRLLDEAGYPDPDGEGPEPRFRLTIKTSIKERYVLQAQIIQAMLAETGIELEIRSYEFATFYSDIKRGSFQLFTLIWTGIVDPDIYSLTLHSARVPPAGANRGRYRNPAFDRLIELGARRTLLAERRPPYLEAQEILARDLPYISLYTKINVALAAAGLEGYRNYPSGELYSLKDVRWSAARADGDPPSAPTS